MVIKNISLNVKESTGFISNISLSVGKNKSRCRVIEIKK